MLHKTTRSELLLSLKSLKAYSEGNLSQQQADAEKGQNITNATGHQGYHPFLKHIDHEQVAEKQQAALRAKFEEFLAKQKAAYKKRVHCMVEKSSRNVRRVSRSTKLKLRPSLTLMRRKLQRSRTRFKRRRIHMKHSNID